MQYLAGGRAMRPIAAQAVTIRSCVVMTITAQDSGKNRARRPSQPLCDRPQQPTPTEEGIRKMKATMTTVVAAVWMATAAATIGLAAPAHADSPVNLTVPDDVRAQLVQAGAVLTGRPAAEFTGLQPGETYYAYDPNSDTYWAAAALSGPKTFDAGVMLQDANSYMMFRKSGQVGAWVPFRVGYGPGALMPPDGDCQLPPAIHDLWQWPTGKCYPPSA
jgi:hypothetical protein